MDKLLYYSDEMVRARQSIELNYLGFSLKPFENGKADLDKILIKVGFLLF